MQLKLEVKACMPGQNSFETSELEVSGNRIFVRHYGKGPAILLVHGFPRASLMWRFVAPKLAENHTVISVNLRASGRSAVPSPTEGHFPYSKRTMAKELVDLVAQLGFLSFAVIGAMIVADALATAWPCSSRSLKTHCIAKVSPRFARNGKRAESPDHPRRGGI